MRYEENIEWASAHVWLDEHGRDIVTILHHGLSLIHCIQHTLGVVYHEKHSLHEMKKLILEEITKKRQFYEECIEGKSDVQDVIEDIHTFFETKFYSKDIFNLLITAILNVFRITIWIFKEDERNMFQSVRYVTDDEVSQRWHAHMIFYCDKDDSVGLGHRYNSVVRKKYNDGQGYISFGEDFQHPQKLGDITDSTPLLKRRQLNRSSASSSSSTLGPSTPGDIPTPNGTPPCTEQEDTPIEMEFDFTNDEDASQYNLTSEDQRVRFPEEIFDDIQPETLKYVPYNINGNHSYRIQVPNNKWHKYQDDGRWFLMHSSTMRNSQVVRKTGKCLRSYTCPNDKCPRYTSGKERNTYAFTSIDLNLFECKTCGRVAQREFCGAMKLTKYHPDTNILEVFYAGKHICELKIRSPYSTMSKKKKKDVLRPILQKNPKATIKQISEEAAESFLWLGKPNMAKEAVRLAQDKRFVAEMREEVLKLVCEKDPN